MAIDKEDIEKYIFDPENPNQCRSYNLLLRIAKKENNSFFSPEFLQYFFGKEVLNDKFEDEFYDFSTNYDSLSFNEKIELYKKQLSESDLEDFKQEIDVNKINICKIINNTFVNKFIDLNNYEYDKLDLTFNDMEKFIQYIVNNIFLRDNIYYKNKKFDDNYYRKAFILFSRNYFEILNAGILKSSIFITMEENIDKFLTYKNNENIKPIFLKRIEDVDLLLNILENDLNKEKQKDIPKEEIETINSIEINNFFSIKNLKLNKLKEKKEIYILGENGDGKTLLLQAIAIALKGVQKDGQEIFREIKSEFDLNIIDSKDKSYTADENNSYKNMFAYGANRNNNCQIKDDEAGYLTLFDSSLDLKDPIKWLQFLDYSENKNEDNVISVAHAKQLIKDLLNKDVDIDINPSEVTFTEKGSKKIEFDRLSAGYKGVITIICDMLVRLSSNQPYITDIKDYQGIVLIDEVELHLHPKWKYDFVKKIREIFPLIQFIFTTHSPTVVLGASKEAVFYKIYKEDGDVCISNQIDNEGYTNNSLISSPLFDLKSITSRYYDKKVSSDDYIIDEELDKI